jgi:uncharacterized membrane protein YtjA (UPF0391 family)
MRKFISSNVIASEHVPGTFHAIIPSTGKKKQKLMIAWTAILMIVAMMAAILGYTGIAGAAAGVAQILFVIFLTMFLVAVLIGRRNA